jgi:hypothetical protein
MLFARAQETEAAFPYYAAGCDKGDAFSCSEMGYLLWLGEGPGATEEAATAAYQRACDLGRLPSCIHILIKYAGGRKGKGLIGKDPKKAVKLSNQLCAAGLDTGCRFAASYYEDGFGVEKDSKRAVGLRNRARRLGDWTKNHPDDWIERRCTP